LKTPDLGRAQTICDTWQYINNTQARLGIAALWITVLIWTSALATAASYYSAVPAAGWLLAPLLLWLTVAAALSWSIWALNGRQPLLPKKLC
jgi:tryptophan-rich sensory protein